MKKLASLLLILIFTAVAPAQHKYKTYGNPRFGYTILFPSDLLAPQPESFNGDGRVFRARNGAAEMRVWAGHHALFRSLKEEYESGLKEYGEVAVTYKVLLRNGFVISGLKGDKIFYRKTIVKKVNDYEVFGTFVIEYEKSEKEVYDLVTADIAKSFKFKKGMYPD